MCCQTTLLMNPRLEAAEPFDHLRPAAAVVQNHPLLKLREK
jgi:hypothetical protein